ncbi:Holliday junction resolvase RecU [Alkalihalobacterium sp. APHAB7]|uniref:Holliday junction resolvase RecU n=1 Tax=Alkalihalobacterium sp. APHAB7 TaxID=3402081 RepID=UPI003AAFF68D
MAIRYPNGKKYSAPVNRSNTNKKETFSNRGMTLEEDLNDTNAYYLSRGIAVIHKKPTPLQIVQVDYPKRSAAVIKEAYFKQASTTDYNGVYRGRHIDFEAKETRNKTSFPLQNFHLHQIEHMKQVLDQQGICFIILRFTLLDEIYYLNASHLVEYYENQKDGRKSIPKAEIAQLGYLIKQEYHPRIDYLKVVDQLFFQN